MLKIMNTQTGALEPFEPIEDNKVNMYVCGPTVYDHAHIGHGRVYVAFDAVVKYLRFSGFGVTYARNITDIDDKIIQRAADTGVSFEEHAQTYTQSFWEDMDQLGLDRPNIEPKATDSIDAIANMIQTLIDKGYAYEKNGDVFFRVRKDSDYGKLSKKNIDDLLSGARVAANDIKEDPLDFALWKATKEGEPSWPSPWGKGRPGWHIECSAMIKSQFGDTIDIHAGGRDLIFPHHENEIAQSECCNDQPLAKYWMHNGFVTMDKEKMSKSIGNTINLKKLFEIVHPEALKMYLLQSHYRSPIDFDIDNLKSSARGLERMYNSMRNVERVVGDEQNQRIDETYVTKFREAMDEDFNTANAIGVLFEIVKEMNKLEIRDENNGRITELYWTLKKLGRDAIGILQSTSRQFLENDPKKKSLDSSLRKKIDDLRMQRENARKSRDFKRADQIRDKLKEMNVTLEDHVDGSSTWHIK